MDMIEEMGMHGNDRNMDMREEMRMQEYGHERGDENAWK